MKQEVFENGTMNNRNIIISITDDYIQFYFEKEYYRHIEWVKNEGEIREQNWENQLTEEESEPQEFYGFNAERWYDQRENFPEHMGRKNWFTMSMLNFINRNAR